MKCLVVASVVILGASTGVRAQVVAEHQGETARRAVAGNDGVSTMVVMDRPAFRVLRDFFEPGAVRRMHAHESAYHVMTVITGTIRIGFEEAAPIDVTQGEVLHLDGGVRHSIENVGTVPATLIEVFDKADAGAPGQ